MKNLSSNIEILALSGKKIFTTQDIAVLWGITERRRLIELIKYYVRQKRLVRVHKGVYAYDVNYSPLEVAQKLVPLSYLSLYTTCQIHGLTFQYYDTTYSISLKSQKIALSKSSHIYHRVKDSIFYNTLGLIQSKSYTYADRERTIADCLYVYPNFAFDNLSKVDTDKLRQISTIYDNKNLVKRINKLCLTVNNTN